MSETAWFTFIHAADLHLDSPFEGLQAPAPQLAARLREATFIAFDAIIELAVSERADFLIVAGDIYDGADRSLKAQLHFRDGLKRAWEEAGVRSFVAHGNHDPLSGWEARLEMPEGVHRFSGEGVEEVVVRRQGEVLAHLYGSSYPVREVRENLIPRFRRSPEAPFAIGVLHCNLGGNPNHDNYAPCTLADLLSANLDYWALGHIHTRQVVRANDPCIIYPGNPQGRSLREVGARGCYLVKVYPSRRVQAEFMPTDLVRWFLKELPIGDLTSLDELLNALESLKEEARAEAGGRGSMLRLILTGRGPLHGALRKANSEGDLAERLQEGEAEREDFVWVEALQNRTRPGLDVAERRETQDFVGDFLKGSEALRRQDDPAAAVLNLLTSHPEHRLIFDQLMGLSSSELLEALAVAETLGLDMLLPEEEG